MSDNAFNLNSRCRIPFRGQCHHRNGSSIHSNGHFTDGLSHSISMPSHQSHLNTPTMATAASTKRGRMEWKDEGLACINYEITYGPIRHCNYQFNGPPLIQLLFKEISNIPLRLLLQHFLLFVVLMLNIL